ncbi:signal recognition particle-docking protein FtsY [Nicoliella spurrieriana]|uniref:Signal recognition particle receptor FtsY n=1 Tax=Nicoliella spurrieriana TaxID=2925830 RepID=A0A976RS56_9LACO|nr:signal recognition particle-docking protein FtsY [Nicoliella spurrieriana]UQS86631.1 signal recognition particle-docking protein FtsY [Nicoliella spurrieriana]
MGLFDIFKRRNKKKQSQSPAPASTGADHTGSASESGNDTLPNSESNVIDQAHAKVSVEQSEATSASETGVESAEATSAVSESDAESSTTTDAVESEASEESKQSASIERSNVDSARNDVSASSETSQETQSNETTPGAEESLEHDEQAPVEAELTSTSSEQPTATSEASDVSDSKAAADTDDSNEVESDAVESAEPTADQETNKYEHGLAKSRSSFGQRLNKLFANFRSVDEEFFEDLEDTLIESDVGFDMAVNLTDELRDEVKLRNVKSRNEVQNVVVQKLIELYDQNGNGEKNTINFAKEGPTVILFVGVNGVGKTTTIGKMAKLYRDQGKKVLLAAADTFRAGAIQQLDVWAQRDQVDIVKRPEKSDPASVVYEAVQKAKKEQYDVLFVDTAGRLQNKVNLMNELAKMKKILTREIPMAPHEVMLVLDATTGQNALSQAKLFKKVTDVTGITLTKLDGTAKGGIVLAIRSELHIPVKYVGLGEKVGDLQPFDASDFVYGLFKGLLK